MSLAPIQNALYLIGAFFVATGFFARRGSLPALVLGTGVFFLGALQGLSNANAGAIALQIAILTPMFRALYAHYLDRTSAARPLRRDHVPLAVVKSVIRPRTDFAETIAPSSRPRIAGVEASGFGAPSLAAAPAPVAPAPAVRTSEASDQRVGPYIVTGTLGSGGMATVYRARQTSVGRDVALKVITGNYNADPEFGERFRREAETTARLSHPHILKVFDFGEEAGRPYLDVVVNDPSVSRLHATISMKGLQPQVVRVSRIGVLTVNLSETESSMLVAGDEIGIGGTVFKVGRRSATS